MNVWYLVLAGVAISPLLFVLIYFHSKFAFALSLICMAIPVTSLGEFLVDTRPAVLLIALVSFARVVFNDSVTSDPVTWHYLAPITLVALASVSWSVSPTESLFAGAAWVTLALSMSVYFRLLGRQQMSVIVYGLLTSLLVISIFSPMVGLGEAWSGQRFQGVMSNPNGLAIVAMLVGCWFLSWRSRRGTFLLLIPIVVIVLTASRAGFIGLLAAGTVVLWRSTNSAFRLLYAPISLGIGWFIWSVGWTPFGGDEGLLRATDSRGDLWRSVLQNLREDPWLGLGFGALDSVGGNSYLKLLAEGGLLGAAAGIFLLIGLVRRAFSEVLVAATLTAGTINALFESWLFTAGSLYCFCLMAIVLGSVSERTSDRDPVVSK